MADGNVSLEARECHFWKMPPELQEMVFELAYGIRSPHALVQNLSGSLATQSWDRKSAARKPFPGSKVQDFLVCKTWFLSAVAAWIKAQRIIPPCDASPALFLAIGLFAEFAREIDLSELTTFGGLQVLRSYRNLRHLNISIMTFDFSARGKFPWLLELEPDDFEKMEIMEPLRTLRGLDECRISRSSYQDSDIQLAAQKEVWKRNLEALESYANSSVLLPKDKSYVRPNTQVKSGPRPLYLGSRVCYGTSRLLPEKCYRGLYGDPFVIDSSYLKSPPPQKVGMSVGMKVPEPTKAVEVIDLLDDTVPKTAHQLLEMLKMTPEQAWNWFQKAKKMARELSSGE